MVLKSQEARRTQQTAKIVLMLATSQSVHQWVLPSYTAEFILLIRVSLVSLSLLRCS